jgi:dsRNA-specific ribonuclease
MGRKQTSRIITIGGIAAIAALVGFMISLQITTMRNNEFKRSIDQIAFDTIDLTQEYKKVEDRWLDNSQDNSDMASTFEQYKQRYQQLIDRAEALDTPDRYKTAEGYLIEAIELEMQSNQHFYNYVISGDISEKEKADELATQSNFRSAEYDAAMEAAG